MLALKKNDTIAAIATPAGIGAIGVIRISGKEALLVGDQIFSKKVTTLSSHTAHYGKILNKEGSPIDHVVLTLMKAPKSYTGEDTLEISCHGSPLILRKILERIFECGARPANPGEFSMRAFLHGKIDLAQAEAVQALIASKNELAMKQAEKQLDGTLSKKISSFQTKLLDVAAILEASVDFPEEDLAFEEASFILAKLEEVLLEMKNLASTFSDGRKMHTGISLTLSGSPNVGKSSLMNALLGFDRAIVTEIAGTTRDILNEDLTFSGLHFQITDTAGIRVTDEVVEKEGIRRSEKAMNDADLILIVLDASRGISHEEKELIAKAPIEKRLIVWNKIDLKPINTDVTSFGVSAKDGIGIDDLKQAITDHIWKKGSPSKEEIVITSLRHHQALISGVTSLESAINGMHKKAFYELISSDVKGALYELSNITGINVTEELLSTIFSKFCLGK